MTTRMTNYIFRRPGIGNDGILKGRSKTSPTKKLQKTLCVSAVSYSAISDHEITDFNLIFPNPLKRLYRLALAVIRLIAAQ